MSETQQELPEDPQQPDSETAPEPGDTGPETVRAGEPIGYALYDDTLQRFVGGVHPTKAKANRKDAKVEGHSYRVVQV